MKGGSSRMGMKCTWQSGRGFKAPFSGVIGLANFPLHRTMPGTLA
jgi:hypothetical protein